MNVRDTAPLALEQTGNSMPVLSLETISDCAEKQASKCLVNGLVCVCNWGNEWDSGLLMSVCSSTCGYFKEEER